MTKAYNDLHRFGEPVLESKKVRDLLTKISDPKLEAAKQTIRITAGYKDNFAAAINFLAESVTPLTKNTTRQIAETQSHRDGTRSNARGGRQQGRGRGGRFPNQYSPPGRGRGGRGRSTGRFNPRGQGRGARYVPYIQPQDWANMSTEEQRGVLSHRSTLQRQIEVVDTDIDHVSQVSGITNPTAQVTPGNNAPTPGANINQVSTSSQATQPFGGRAAYRQP
jgi:hypothetical protein